MTVLEDKLVCTMQMDMCVPAGTQLSILCHLVPDQLHHPTHEMLHELQQQTMVWYKHTDANNASNNSS